MLWQVNVRDLLIPQDLDIALDRETNKPPMMSDEWRRIDLKVVSSIHLALADDVLYNVLGENSTIIRVGLDPGVLSCTPNWYQNHVLDLLVIVCNGREDAKLQVRDR